jgi:hypothetical protein
MSYNVTIIANSLEELADKALALGGRLTLASNRPTVTATEIVKVARATKTTATEVVKAAEPAPEPEPVAEPVPDYATVVGPAVLALVDAKGKPAAKAVLASYNAAKADQVPQARWAQLVADLNAAKNA